ncbi:TIGR04282 family arsenosugar biosynthesis glycosyltransferase [Thiolapillus sp.]
MTFGKILVFARAPVPGKTKTRLIPALGPEGAAELHTLLLEQTLFKVCSLQACPVELWCTPDTEQAFFQRCSENFGVRLKSQRGEDLGARMRWAFESALADAPWAILLGSDCPDLRGEDIQQAIAALDKGADAVAGPAHDGGYYLLGLRKAAPELFSKIPWGTGRVWELTRERLQQLGWRYSMLRRQHDLDRPEDLRHFPQLRELLRNAAHLPDPR